MENQKKQNKSRFKRVCVFCGSSSGKRDVYGDAAIELAQELVEKRLDLVYGGGSIGLMGLISQAVHCGGGHVLGIIPRALMGKEKTGESIGEVKAVADMHQRKAEMARHSDCFIALPGPFFSKCHILQLFNAQQAYIVQLFEAIRYTFVQLFNAQHVYPVQRFKAAGGYGTLEELLEVITWAQLGIHDKPVGLLNVDGYYNYLLTFIDKAVDDGFIKPSQRHIFVAAPTAKELVQKLEDYIPVKDGAIPQAKWEVEQQPVAFNTLHTEIAL